MADYRTKLSLYNMKRDITSGMLCHTFGAFGHVILALVVRNVHGVSSGCGMIHFLRRDDAAQALKWVNTIFAKYGGMIGEIGAMEYPYTNHLMAVVSQLPPNVNPSALREIFSKYGKVLSLNVYVINTLFKYGYHSLHGLNQKFQVIEGRAIVTMETSAQMAAALADLHGRFIVGGMGVPIMVNYFVSPTELNSGLNIMVCNLPPNVNSARLSSLFSIFGNVCWMRIMMDPKGVCLGNAFVKMVDYYQGIHALANISGCIFMGNRLHCVIAMGEEH